MRSGLDYPEGEIGGVLSSGRMGRALQASDPGRWRFSRSKSQKEGKDDTQMSVWAWVGTEQCVKSRNVLWA